MNRAVRAAAALAVCAPAAAAAQSVAQRVATSDATVVQFSFAARAGVCGDGQGFISTGARTISGNEGALEPGACVAGPVRVVLVRAGGGVVDLETFVGPPAVAADATDLGMVSASDAVDYLLSLASEVGGRPGRDAILPAALADSVTVAPRLLALASDQDHPRETRQRALSWAGSTSGPTASASVMRGIRDIATDPSDSRSVRRHAVQVLARLDRGAGVEDVLTLTESSDRWLAQEALSALARSGDPRVKPALRGVAQRSDAPDGMRVTAIRGLGRYASADDAAFLRSLYARLDDEDTREAVITSLTELGGRANVAWLLEVAGDEAQPVGLRRRAARGAARAGATTPELVRLYDAATSREFKRVLVDLYVQIGDEAAVDKLLVIARGEPDRDVRRRTISRLARVDDPRVKEALRELVEQ